MGSLRHRPVYPISDDGFCISSDSGGRRGYPQLRESGQTYHKRITNLIMLMFNSTSCSKVSEMVVLSLSRSLGTCAVQQSPAFLGNLRLWKAFGEYLELVFVGLSHLWLAVELDGRRS